MNRYDYSRAHADPLADAAPPLALDRQRIIHSAAFRRLQYKTQVFLAIDEDHFRTRLTHTLEVADLARRLATALDLNADLAEVVALAHDLGHPPFGHAGEQALAACLRDHGGFEHNAHALRVIEYLEHPYPQFRGLNLTRIVRECLAKHRTPFDQPAPHPLQDGRPPPPEGLVAALADQLAYALHDLQDGVFAGLIDPRALAGLRLWQAVSEAAAPPAAPVRAVLRPAIDRLRDGLVRDVVENASAARSASRVGSGDSGSWFRSERTGDCDQPVVALSPAMRSAVDELMQLVSDVVYRDCRVVRMDYKAGRILTAVFEAYVAEPALLPPRYAARVAEQGVHRVAADYVAGMTDRFCLREHARLFDPRIEA